MVISYASPATSLFTISSGEEREYEVELSRIRWEHAKTRVRARSSEEAELKAVKLADELDWRAGNTDDVEVTKIKLS